MDEKQENQVEWPPKRDGSYFPFDEEFGYSTKCHKWLHNGRVLSDKEAIHVYDEKSEAQRRERS